MTKGRIVLVRHGESFGNRWETSFRDDSTNFLTLEGTGQAMVCGNLLKDYKFEFANVYTSQLARAKHTAKIILQILEQPEMHIHVSEDLNEREAMPHPSDDGPRIQLETFDELDDRVLPRIRESVIPKLDQGNVLVVSHYYVMQSILFNLYQHQWVTRHDIHIDHAVPYVLGDDSFFKLVMPPTCADDFEEMLDEIKESSTNA